MKNLFKKNNIENNTEEKEICNFCQSVFSSINPEESLLKSILLRCEENFVTNSERSRFKEKDSGRLLVFNWFFDLLGSMNKAVKVLSGTAVVSALVLVLILIRGSNELPISTSVENTKSFQSKKIDRSVETDLKESVFSVEVMASVDVLVEELTEIDSEFIEPYPEAGDIFLSELININDYEI